MPDRILQFLFHFFLTSVQCRQFFPGICPIPAIAFLFLCAKSFHFPGICVVLIVIFGE